MIKEVYGNTREDRQTPTGRERTHPSGGDTEGLEEEGVWHQTELSRVWHVQRKQADLLRARTSHSMSIYRVTKLWQAQFQSDNIREEKTQKL